MNRQLKRQINRWLVTPQQFSVQRTKFVYLSNTPSSRTVYYALSLSLVIINTYQSNESSFPGAGYRTRNSEQLCVTIKPVVSLCYSLTVNLEITGSNLLCFFFFFLKGKTVRLFPTAAVCSGLARLE